jgi:hypothetical protein
LVVASGTAFAAPSKAAAPKNAVGLQFAPLFNGLISMDSDAKTSMGGVGVDYERFLTSSISVGAQFSFMLGKVNNTDAKYFAVGAFARYYPKILDHIVFMFSDLGWNMLRYNKKTDFSGFTFGCGLGGRCPITIAKQHFYAEATTEYLNAKASGDVPFTPSGWEVGLNLGWAF